MDDYISRQGAIKSLYNEIIKRRLLDDVNDGMLDEFDTESVLRKVPSEDVQPVRHGHWIKHSPGQYECNICGKIVVADDANELNYCCNCGTIMEGEQNGSN